jgi:ABC-2 type transport system permease protein
MTSANLSLGERLKNHRTYINRTLWSSYIALPFLAAYFILGVIMMISRTINYAARYNQSDAVLYQEKLRAVSRVLGVEQLGFVFVIGIAVMFALQGFSYVFSTSKLDFYLSQPTTRSQRIAKNYFDAITTFLIIYVGCEVIALIIAACMGAVGKYLYLSVLIETIRAFNLFFAFYNITVLAVMLSGTLPIAILLTGCFAFISILFAGELYFFKNIFYATFSSAQPLRVWFSPMYDRFGVYVSLVEELRSSNAMISSEYMSGIMASIIPHEIDILVTGLIAFVFVLIFARMRQSEWAGKGIVIRPFRWLVKIVVCVATGLGVGYIVYLVYESVWTTRLFTQMCLIMVLATIVAGCIAEVLLERNIKKVFKGKAQTIMALAIVLLIFTIFKGDLLGFDSYVPAADKIESCAIANNGWQFNLYDRVMYNGSISDDELMTITNTEDFVKLAKAGMETRKIQQKNYEEDIYENLGYDIQILYRLKSGRKVYRYITVPFKTVDTELARIIDSEEFKRGYFDIFNDDAVRKLDNPALHNLSYESGGKSVATKNFVYEEFSEAYRKDILENYSFEYMSTHMPVGTVIYEGNNDSYVYGNLDVFDNYANTIAYLKKLGIYKENKLNASDVREVKVDNYYPGYDLETMPYSDVDINVETSHASYTDPEQIKELLSVIVESGYYNPWYDYSLINDQYSVQVYRNGEFDEHLSTYYSILKGKVPQFVKEDTN